VSRVVVTRGGLPFELMPAGTTALQARERVEELDRCPENVAIHSQWGFGRVAYGWHEVPEGPLPLPTPPQEQDP
jgi:hypothetical protein